MPPETCAELNWIAHRQPDAKRSSDAEGNWQAVTARNDRDRQARGRKDRAHGNVEFSGDHQETHGKRNDPDFGGRVEPTRPARRAEEDRAAEDGEENVGDDQSNERPDLGPPGETAYATAYARARRHGFTPSIRRI
jgi:hypothetical protein